MLFVMPTSTQYTFVDYSFGGGSASSSSDAYGGNFTAGDTGGPSLSGTAYDALPGITYSIQAPTPFAPSLVNTNSYYNRLDITLPESSNTSWYNGSWSSRKQITIDYTQVSGSSDLTDFPLLISLGVDSDLAADAQADADDIVFTSADGTTILAHEIEYFDESTGELQAWVQIPTLSHTANTVIYMYYGNSGTSSQQNMTGVWHSNYKMVQHLQESPANNTAGHLDSTSNGIHGTPQGFDSTSTSNTNTTGIIDGADIFDGSNDFVDLGNVLGFTSSFSASAWVYMEDYASCGNYYINKLGGSGARDWSLMNECGGFLFRISENASTVVNQYSSVDPSLYQNEWVHLVGVYNASTQKLDIFVNGVNTSANPSLVAPTSINATSNAVRIGSRQSDSSYFDGKLDEVRVLNIPLSADWIATEFNNQDSPSTFYTVGTEESDSGPSAGPSDTEFAIAISPDAFTTTYYVRSDGTLTTTFTEAAWQTYTAWGGDTGSSIIGLSPNTTYTAKVKARQGIFTQSPWGPTDSATTNSLSVQFDLDVNSTDTETSPPYELSLNELSAGSVVTSADSVWVDITTNAQNGATVYLQGAAGGLQSVAAGHTITSASDDLATQSEGVGIQAVSASQGSGGPLTALAPYNGTGSNVGVIPQQLESLFTSSAAITNGRGSFAIKAKASGLTPAATDYSEILTIVAVPSF